MKRICTLLAGLLIAAFSFAQPAITAVYLPKYIQGSGTFDPADDKKVPYICRLTISNLTPNATYKFHCRFVDDPGTSNNGDGDGFFIRTSTTGNFQRFETPSFINDFGTFTASPAGSYTGWFMAEGNYLGMFEPGLQVYFRVCLNNGNNGFPVVARPTVQTPIDVINYGSTPTDGTGIRSTAALSGTAKNVVLLWDNAAGTGRPIAGTIIESDGMTNTVADGFAPFYATSVDGQAKTWGTIIPNNLAGGIKKIVQYNLSDGAEVGSNASATGSWAAAAGGTVNTVNANGGLTTVLALNGNLVTLGAPVKNDQTITFNAFAATTYGAADLKPDALASSGLKVTFTSSNPAVAQIVDDTVVHVVGAGTADITAVQAGDADYNAAPNVVRTLVVDKASLTIKADDKVWLQGSPMPDMSATYTGFVNGDDSTDLNPRTQFHTLANSGSAPGPYDIIVDGAGSNNYTFNYQPGVLTVVSNKQPQLITFNAIPDKVYGIADFNPGAVVNSPLQVTYTSSDPTIVAVVNNLLHIIKTGTVTITASQPGNSTYEAALDVQQSLTITKATLTITAEDKEKLYLQPHPAFTVIFSGFVNGDTKNVLTTQPTATTTAAVDAVPGDYIITAAGAAAANYDLVYVNGKLTIRPLATQTITFNTLPVKKYGDADFNAGGRASSGLTVTYRSSNTNVATIIRDSVIHIVGTGTTDITASQAGDATRAAAPDVVRTLTVQKATLTIKANDQKKNEGQANPPLTVTYTGFVNGDDATKLSTLPVATTTATNASLAANYPITISGATAVNYTIQHQNGVLTILPAQGDGMDNLYAFLSAPGQLQVNVHAANAAKVNEQLFDVNGSRLYNTPIALNKGFNTYRLAIGNLAPGVYNVRVAGNGVLLKTKVVIK